MNLKNLMPQFHFNIERWKYYMPMDVYISSFGRFKDKNGTILSPTAKDNYLVFRGESVHRLVMTVFKPQPGCAGLTIDHLDHNTRNNKVDNLEWVTKEENQARAKKDAEENGKTMLAVQQEEISKFKTMMKTTICVELNGTKVPIEVAHNIMLGSKELQQCKPKVDRLISDMKAGKVSAEVTLSNYKIKVVQQKDVKIIC